MLISKMPEAVKPFARDLTWNFSRDERKIYLTFDDGPMPGVTDRVLDILDEYDAQATFFCIGGNVQSHPSLFARITDEGHAVGNHTWNHMNGRQYGDFAYFKNVLQCAQVVPSRLFRPPYGRIRRSQIKALISRFQIIMWDIITGDWRADLSPQKCLDNATRHTRSGAIVVMHDSYKAQKNMLYTLPRALEIWKRHGYSMVAIPQPAFGASDSD